MIKPCILHVKYDFNKPLSGRDEAKEFEPREEPDEAKKFDVANIHFLEPNYYNDYTIIEEDGDIQISTHLHYRSTGTGASGQYQLGFIIESENEGNNSEFTIIKKADAGGKLIIYDHHYHNEKKVHCFFESIKFKHNGNCYVPSEGTLEYIVPGGYNVEIYQKGKLWGKRKKVHVVPSSMPEEDYNIMLSELVAIHQKLITAKNADVIEEGYYQYTIESIMKCIDKLEKSMKEINKNPAMCLLPEMKKVRHNNIKKYSPKMIVKKTLYRFSNQMVASNAESTAVFENYAIKYALHELKKRVETSKPRDFSYVYEDNKDDDQAGSDKYLREDLKEAKKCRDERRDEENKSKERIIKCYEDSLERIDALLKMDFIHKLILKPTYLKPTQVFVNDPHYFAVLNALKELDTKISFLSGVDEAFFTPYPTHFIYEIWCYFKLIDMMEAIGFILQKREEVFAKKHLEDTIIKYIKDGIVESAVHKCTMEKAWEKDGTTLEITLEIIYQNKIPLNKGINNNNRIPDFTIVITKGSTRKIILLDAKYKNYKDQGVHVYKKDLQDTAIKKYLLGTQGSEEYRADASFIIHPDTNKSAYFGGYIRNEIFDDEDEVIPDITPPKHKFGSFAFVPSNFRHMKTFIKLVMEYFMGMGSAESDGLQCFNCGANRDVLKIRELKTDRGYPKWHITCGECGEFWVDTHCGKGHKLYKHKDNYFHHPDPNYNNNIWFVCCPECE